MNPSTVAERRIGTRQQIEESMRTTVAERLAAVLLALEGVGLLALAGWEIVALVSGDAGSVASSVALTVLTVLGAVAVLAFAGAVWRGASWGRSGGIVTQVLALAVVLGALTGQEPNPTTAVALAVPAVLTLVLLVAGARAAGRRARAQD
jgi:hypothetical protein